MGMEELSNDLDALKTLEAEILAVKKHLESLIKQKNSLLQRGKRSAPPEDYHATTAAKRKKEDFTPIDEVAANIEVSSGKSSQNENDTTKTNENPNGTDENQKEDGWQKVQKKRVPPVFVYNVNDWVSLANTLKLLCTEEFSARNSTDNIKIQPKNADDYRNITRFLETEEIEFHTYNLDKSSVIKIVIKNLPVSTKVDAIKQELLDKGFDVSTVAQMRNKHQENIPMFMATLNKDEKTKNIYSLSTLCYCKVKIEPFKKRESLTQCHRCQRFGHTSQTCKARPKCVKCAGEHLTAECQKKENTPANCINCGGKHPANYKGCEYYKDSFQKALAQKMREKSNTKSSEMKKAISSTINFTPRLSFAKVLATNSNKNLQTEKEKTTESTQNNKKSEPNPDIQSTLKALLAVLQKLVQ